MSTAMPEGASQALFAAILSIAADAIITVDDDQRIVDFNEGAERVFGYTADEARGQPLELLLPSRFRTNHREHVQQFGIGREVARQMGHRREIYGRRKDGTEFPAEASIAQLQLPDGRRVYSAVLRDITERKRAEQEQHFVIRASAVLAESLDYETTIASVPALAVPAIAEWCALDLIEASDSVHGLRHVSAPRSEDALPRALAALYPMDPDSPWPLQDVLRSGRPISALIDDEWLEANVARAHHAAIRDAGLGSIIMLPLRARHRSLGVLTLARSIRVRPFDGGDLVLAGEFVSRASLAIDAATLYRAAQRATSARDEVLGVVSHDLRNPLSAIAMCASALRSRSDADPQALAGTIAESAEWMQRLIRDLLDVAAIESGHLSLERQEEDATAIVERAHEMFAPEAHRHGIMLDLDVPAEPLLLQGDPERILQVLANLVSNAIKFTESSGTVEIGVRATTGGAEFRVSDTGAGIPPEHVAHLFELYWHARRSGRDHGSGYGLAIARGIVSAHGGRIWVDSTLGEGSTFTFTIPR